MNQKAKNWIFISQGKYFVFNFVRISKFKRIQRQTVINRSLSPSSVSKLSRNKPLKPIDIDEVFKNSWEHDIDGSFKHKFSLIGTNSKISITEPLSFKHYSEQSSFTLGSNTHKI